MLFVYDDGYVNMVDMSTIIDIGQWVTDWPNAIFFYAELVEVDV